MTGTPRCTLDGCKGLNGNRQAGHGDTTGLAVSMSVVRCDDAFLMEAMLTLGLVSVILGTASGAQNLGVLGAIGVGSYIALAGLA